MDNDLLSAQLQGAISSSETDAPQSLLDEVEETPSSALEGADILGAAASPETTVERRSANLTAKGDNTDEVLNGTRDDDRLLGQGGADKLKGKAGNDVLFGGDGNDTVIGGGGNDNIKGGGGDDKLVGGGGDDTLKGQGGDDNMRGGGGDDVIKGQGGDDIIKGNGGDDNIVGGGGDDTIFAGSGNDTLKGGGGADIFQFVKADFKKVEQTEIKAFQIGSDKIDLVKLNLGDFADLDLTQDGKNAVLAIEKGQIVFLGRKASDLSADDFLMSQADRDALIPDEPTTPVVPATPISPTTPTDPTTPTNPADPIDPVDPVNSNITGDNNANALDGDERNNLIRGLGGDDTLGAGEGADTLEGGTGKDVFAIQLVNGAIDPTLDTVTDFNYAIDGDEIGLLEVLNSVSFGDLRDVVDANIVGADTIISVRQSTADPFIDVLKLEGVQFTIDSLENNALVAPAANSTAFVENPFGFTNGSRTTADPDATSDGRFVVWVDQQNLDKDQFDFDPDGTTNNAQDDATRDVFIRNTSTQDIRRVSVREETDQSAAVSPVVSEDGRFVAYVQGEGNNGGNVFVRDMNNPDSAPVRVDVHQDGSIPTNTGTEILKNQSGNLSNSIANDSRSTIDMSADGSRIVFSSVTQLFDGDNTVSTDVYLRDVDAGTTTLLSDFDTSISDAGDLVKISDDGRYVLFTSTVDGQAGDADLFLLDTQSGEKLMISTPTPGEIGGFDISADGSRIVFATGEAISISDTNDTNDIYVADVNLDTFTVTDNQRVSLAEGQFQTLDGFLSSGSASEDTFYAPTISPDGTKIIFLSASLDLVSFGDQHELKSGNLYEKMYLLDLTTGEITVPDTPYAKADDRSLETNAVLTNDGFFYPTDFTASDGSGSVGTADSIIFGTAVAPDVEEVTGARIQSAEVENETSFRSQIDSASDVDIFFLKDQGDDRDILVYVAGVDSNGGSLEDPELRLFKTNGEEIFDGLGSTARDEFFNFAGGEAVFIEVTSEDGGTGSYRVTILDQDADLEDIPVNPTDPFMF